VSFSVVAIFAEVILFGASAIGPFANSTVPADKVRAFRPLLESGLPDSVGL
jgi:hypothetical protein